jgi:hypothetical protein
MFSLIWRFFPGPAWLRIIVILAVLAGLAYALIFYGYPWATAFFEDENDISTVGS